MIMETTAAANIPSALRLLISMGSMRASWAQTIAAPATGEIARPNVPLKNAAEPKSDILKPKSAACGVIAPLNAKVAASPEPHSVAMIIGPNAAANVAI